MNQVTSAQSTISEKYEVQNEKYYLNLPLWPNFDVYNKAIDGLIPSCRLKSWEEFDDIVKHYCENDLEGNYVFRGQKHYKWQLEPTLDRLVDGAVTNNIAQKQLSNFKLSTRGRLNDKSILDTESELWALGQHHGLATPLLDWSLSPYVALFFAFEGADEAAWVDKNENCNNHSRSIYILNKEFIQDLDEAQSLMDGRDLKIVEPSIDDHGRLVNQAGLFTFSPYGETLESALEKHLSDSGVDLDDAQEIAKYICKIHIPNKNARSPCLKKLRKMNIHHASLFPDLIGASGYCNDLIRDFVSSKQVSDTTGKRSDNTIELTKEPSWSKHQLSANETATTLIAATIVDGAILRHTSPEAVAKVVKQLIDFINESAGVDWYKREPILARLRNIVRRSLKKNQFPEEYIPAATEALITKAAEMSSEVENSSIFQPDV